VTGDGWLWTEWIWGRVTVILRLEICQKSDPDVPL
jgi:hypothetical protein